MTKKLLEITNFEIIIFSRNEKMQFEHKQKFNSDRIKYIIGDIKTTRNKSLTNHS